MSIEAKEHAEGDIIAEKFRVVRRLGRGGMGSVYEAEHVLTHRRVALKVMHAFADDSETVRQRFLREARAACAIRHPAIVPVHDIFPSGNGIVLVMDLLVGQTLFDLEEQSPGRKVHPLLVVEHALPIVSALGALHAAGFIHRDIKPENIFITDGGSYLLDLGIVKDERSPTVTRLTTDGGIGTPLYMSPEQAFNKPSDHRVDVWSLGLVLYEALSGEVPTMASSIGAIYQLIGAASFRPLSSVAPEVPEPIARLVDAMVSGDPDQRPPSMQLVYDTLAAHASSGVLARYARPDRPMKEQREGPSQAATPSAPRPKLALSETNPAAIAPAGARQSSVEAPPMTTPTALPARGKNRGLLVAIGALSVVLVAGIGVLATLLATGRLGRQPSSAQAAPESAQARAASAEPTATAAAATATGTSVATTAPSGEAGAPSATATASAERSAATSAPKASATAQRVAAPTKPSTTTKPIIPPVGTTPPPPPPVSTGSLIFRPDN